MSGGAVGTCASQFGCCCKCQRLGCGVPYLRSCFIESPTNLAGTLSATCVHHAFNQRVGTTDCCVGTSSMVRLKDGLSRTGITKPSAGAADDIVVRVVVRSSSEFTLDRAALWSLCHEISRNSVMASVEIVGSERGPGCKEGQIH